MAFTSSAGYKNDVFVSYAHVDDTSILDNKRGWVTNFIDDLQKELIKKLGNKKGEIPSIWKDEKLAHNIPLNTSLTEEIKQTATYLIIMSPAYLRSDWCLKERHKFLQILKEMGSDTRVFIVEIDEIDRNKYPKEINDGLIPCRFWTKEGKIVRTMGVTTRGTEEYYTSLLDITKDFVDELTRIKENTQEQKRKGSIFLAQTTDDLDDKREELKRYLKDTGFKILEENLFANENSSITKEKVIKNLEESLVYIQLLSELPGRKVLEDSERIGKFQFDIAKKNLQVKKLIWRSSNFDIDKVADLGYREILKSEYVRAGGFEEFKSAIPEEFKSSVPITVLNGGKEPLGGDSTKKSKLIYICSDSTDREYSKKTILDAINNRKPRKNEINCFFPLDNTNSIDPRKYNEESILGSDAALFVYCNSDPGTVLSQLNYCLKTSVDRKSPFEVFALYDGPPLVKAQIPIIIESENFIYLNCRESLKDFTEKFLNRL